MDHLNQVVYTIALTMGVGWASGINLYGAIVMLGAMGLSEAVVLPPDLQVLANPLVIAVAGFMYAVEFFADKTPGVDTGWDAIHTFIRIPAGAVLAAGAVGEVEPAFSLAAALIGGGMAAGTHFTKAGSRVLINTSPEPFSNWGMSFLEDISVGVGLWLALFHPILFLILLVGFVIMIIWALPRLWKGIKKVFGFLKRFFGGQTEESQDEIIRELPPPQP